MSRLAQPLAELLEADFGDWTPFLRRWQASAEGQALIGAVDARVAAGTAVFPPSPFRALALTPLREAKVLILGQDPYHGAGQAEGLAFSVPDGVRHPPSLRNIFVERQRDLGLTPPAASGSLRAWADQGVLLLNSSLTVEEAAAGSHAKLGWHALTDAICLALAQHAAAKVFMLWGNHAQAKAPLLAPGGAHLVLQSNHPSPLSARRPPVPFIGNGHFSAANRFLAAAGRGAIAW